MNCKNACAFNLFSPLWVKNKQRDGVMKYAFLPGPITVIAKNTQTMFIWIQIGVYIKKEQCLKHC